MQAGKKKVIIRIASYALLAGGLYFLISGAREVLTPWIHQKIAALPDSPSDPPGERPSPDKLNRNLFRPGDTVARLSIPRLDGVWSIVEGTDKRNLRLGPGHLVGSAFPGEKGNCIIAGHRDTQFRILKDIREGDDIVLETSVGAYRYRVTGTRIVKISNTDSLADTSKGALSLITCYPFYYLGNAPKRFVVRATLIGPEVTSASASAN